MTDMTEHLIRYNGLEDKIGSINRRIEALESLAYAARSTDTRMVDDFLVFLKQVKPDVVRDFHIWLEAKKKVVG
jgi:hypothetical protein